MSDSFFTMRNGYDRQAVTWSQSDCESILEASVRRLAQLEGPFEAAKRSQRLADICAGAYVLPIEHWQKLEAPKPTPTTTKSFWRSLIASAGAQYWTGFLVGFFIGRY